MNYSLEIDDMKVGSRAPQLFICSKHLSKLHITSCRTCDVQDDMRRLCMLYEEQENRAVAGYTVLCPQLLCLSRCAYSARQIHRNLR